jgi:hypothetical protein
MNWKSKYVVLRPDPDNSKYTEVFEAELISKARYWLRYIAQVGDVLCITPLHPDNKSSKLAYHSHKVTSGTVESNPNKWGKDYSAIALPE